MSKKPLSQMPLEEKHDLMLEMAKDLPPEQTNPFPPMDPGATPHKVANTIIRHLWKAKRGLTPH